MSGPETIPKHNRIPLTKQEFNFLEGAFLHDPNPGTRELGRMSVQTNITYARLANWFERRRRLEQVLNARDETTPANAATQPQHSSSTHKVPDRPLPVNNAQQSEQAHPTGDPPRTARPSRFPDPQVALTTYRLAAAHNAYYAKQSDSPLNPRNLQAAHDRYCADVMLQGGWERFIDSELDPSRK